MRRYGQPGWYSFVSVGVCVLLTVFFMFILALINRYWDQILLSTFSGIVLSTMVALILKMLVKNKRIIKRIKKGMFRVIGCIIIGSLLVSIAPVNAFFQKSFDNIGRIIHGEETQPTGSTEPTSPTKPSSKPTSATDSPLDNEYLQFCKNHSVSIKLSEPRVLPSEIIYYDQVYLYDTDFLPLDYLQNIKSSENSIPAENNIYRYEKAENDFYNNEKSAKKYADYYGKDNTWVNKLPLEQDLIQVIKIQDEVAQETPNYKVYYRMSNNYQTLALEHLKQDSPKNIVKVYLQKSALCDIESIRYCISNEEFVISLNRLKTRYSDILTYCDNNKEEEKQLYYLTEQLELF